MKSLLIKISFLIPFVGLSQNLLINTFNRNTTILDGTWHYIIAPYETGYYNYRYQPYDQLPEKNNSAFYNNYHAKNKLEIVKYDFEHNKPVTRLIDYIFISKNNQLKVEKYAVLSDSKDLKYPSDHLPVYVEFILKTQQ